VETLTLILSLRQRERRARERTQGYARANAEGISAHFSHLAPLVGRGLR
jgi:hypothetical protein